MSERPRTWTIRPLCFGEFPHMEKSGFTYFRDQGVKISAPAIGYLLRSGDDAVLVDTGPGDPATNHPSHTELRRASDQVPDAALAAAGVRAETLDLVVLTHLHYDHSYNLELFPNATFVVQADELREAVDPVTPQRNIYEFGLADADPPWRSVTHRLRVVRGDVDLVPGIRLVRLPGHTPGLQGVLVETTAGPHLIAGDAASTYENIGTGPHDAVLPGIHTDLVACQRSIERMHAVADTILPGHDWAVFDRQVYPSE